eukprot:403370126
MNNTTTTQQSTISNHGNSNNSFVLNINNPSADVVQIRELIDDFRNLLANNIMPHVIQGQPIHAPGPAQLPQPQNQQAAAPGQVHNLPQPQNIQAAAGPVPLAQLNQNQQQNLQGVAAPPLVQGVAVPPLAQVDAPQPQNLQAINQPAPQPQIQPQDPQNQAPPQDPQNAGPDNDESDSENASTTSADEDYDESQSDQISDSESDVEEEPERNQPNQSDQDFQNVDDQSSDDDGSNDGSDGTGDQGSGSSMIVDMASSSTASSQDGQRDLPSAQANPSSTNINFEVPQSNEEQKQPQDCAICLHFASLDLSLIDVNSFSSCISPNLHVLGSLLFNDKVEGGTAHNRATSLLWEDVKSLFKQQELRIKNQMDMEKHQNMCEVFKQKQMNAESTKANEAIQKTPPSKMALRKRLQKIDYKEKSIKSKLTNSQHTDEEKATSEKKRAINQISHTSDTQPTRASGKKQPQRTRNAKGILKEQTSTAKDVKNIDNSLLAKFFNNHSPI